MLFGGAGEVEDVAKDSFEFIISEILARPEVDNTNNLTSIETKDFFEFRGAIPLIFKRGFRGSSIFLTISVCPFLNKIMKSDLLFRIKTRI